MQIVLGKSKAFQSVGSIPLERPGPRRRGICLIKASDDKKASYFFASFFTSFLFLFSLAKSMESTVSALKYQIYHELLQVIHRHVLELNLLCTVDVGSIG